jgi:hypothetical protein
MTLADRQLEMLRRMAALDPPPVFMGGFAEDARAAGTVTRPHEDLDWVFPRGELELRRAQAERLGVGVVRHWSRRLGSLALVRELWVKESEEWPRMS